MVRLFQHLVFAGSSQLMVNVVFYLYHVSFNKHIFLIPFMFLCLIFPGSSIPSKSQDDYGTHKMWLRNSAFVFQVTDNVA